MFRHKRCSLASLQLSSGGRRGGPPATIRGSATPCHLSPKQEQNGKNQPFLVIFWTFPPWRCTLPPQCPPLKKVFKCHHCNCHLITKHMQKDWTFAELRIENIWRYHNSPPCVTVKWHEGQTSFLLLSLVKTL